MRKTVAGTTEIMLSIVLLTQYGCFECSVEREFNHPSRPEQVHEWKEFQYRSLTVNGEFVLMEGQSVDNGKVGVKVIALTSAKCSLTREPEFPSAKIQFYEVSDGKVICESIFRPGSAFLRRPHVCGENFEWDVLGITAINAGEKWVAFRLVK